MSYSFLENQQLILTLAHQFSDAANRKDAALYRSVWTDDSKWIIGPPINQQFDGVDEIVAAFENLLGGWEFFVQLTASYHIKIDGNSATANFYVNEIARIKDGDSNYNLAMYQDKLVLKDGKWLFKERNYNVLYLDQSPLKGIAFHQS
ncbi:MAG: nuclear transport factor 2 family protein [Rhizobacter sp.]|nr:nuclear transport factor 2 family protein [Ferruginibacter sp.]